MKFSRLIKDIQDRQIKLPEQGSGRNGKILNSDLIDALANDSLMKMDKVPDSLYIRLNLDEVQLSYRFTDLPKARQDNIWEDDSWALEEKYNGARFVVIYEPEEGLAVYGRNRSIADYLPTNYTSKLLFGDKLGKEFAYSFGDVPFVLDCEGFTEGYVETKHGLFTNKSLNATVALLQLESSEAIHQQRTTAPWKWTVFDCLLVDEELPVRNPDYLLTHLPYKVRKNQSSNLVLSLQSEGIDNIFYSPYFVAEKKTRFEHLLNAGKEGAILKNLNAPYCPGKRDKTVNIKVKRSVANSWSKDLDAFISGYTLGEEWSKQGLIAGVELSVYLQNEHGDQTEHHIATVSGIPLELRKELSEVGFGVIHLKEKYYNKVLTIDGQDISARYRRLSHAVADWERGFREDKSFTDCIMEESFVDSQMF